MTETEILEATTLQDVDEVPVDFFDIAFDTAPLSPLIIDFWIVR
jgi:hypothetical protein